MAEGGYKHMKVKHGQQKFVLPYRSYDEFVDKCKTKFGIEQNKDVFFMLPGDDAELDPDCVNDLSNNQTLQISIRAKESKSNDQSNTGLDCYDESIYKTASDEDEEEFKEHMWFKWGDWSALKNHLQQYGTKNIAELLEDSLEGWKREPVHIAITGQSGKGKSSLINAFLGLTEVDDGAAQVGEKETTAECKQYNHPRYENIALWDIPGCGTQNFPKQSYMKSINADRYDFFLLVSSERVHQLDIWLAQKILKRKGSGKCYFVRSKVDIDMDNRSKRHRLKGGTWTNTELFQKFRVEVKTDIQKALGEDCLIQLFLLSSHFPNKYDFGELQLRLLEDALTSKRCSLVFGMNGITEKLLEYKVKTLRSRQSHIALLSFFSRNANREQLFRCDIDYIKSEIMLYQEQLSLDQRGLAFMASLIGERPEVIRKNVEFKTVIPASTDSLIQTLNVLYHKRHESRPFLMKLKQFCTDIDITAVATIETFLNEQLQNAIKDSESLVKFIKTRKENQAV
ncbi:T-cell-specific guanine nucleotide triphosphate-binding protein 2-like [Mercenaria mercenaria]|uniref:T-cell-specific guanine nucleotide triphosphate-binding protein 2-like n=1 Tax=Mercenaria mercenaria TaxID=6596 RepID=UPI00234F6AC1|nr:T-cell-specific guanine nucleotide triphosphate-binding protein 2-like [Mercenaria mercenaria]